MLTTNAAFIIYDLATANRCRYRAATDDEVIDTMCTTDTTAWRREFTPNLLLCRDITVTSTSAAVIDRATELTRATAMTVSDREADVMFNAFVGNGRC